MKLTPMLIVGRRGAALVDAERSAVMVLRGRHHHPTEWRRMVCVQTTTRNVLVVSRPLDGTLVDETMVKLGRWKAQSVPNEDEIETLADSRAPELPPRYEELGEWEAIDQADPAGETGITEIISWSGRRFLIDWDRRLFHVLDDDGGLPLAWRPADEITPIRVGRPFRVGSLSPMLLGSWSTSRVKSVRRHPSWPHT